MDASKVWANDGSKSCAAWLGRAAGRDRTECSGLVRHGRALRTMPLVEEAFSAGRITSRHVARLTKAAKAAPEAFSADEEWLVAQATRLRFDDFVALVRYWEQCAKPDEAEDDATDRYRARSARLSGGMYGTGLLDVEFEPVGYATFAEALHRIEQEFWEADWAEARSRLGDAASKADLVRSAAQRRYDAVVEMARRSAAMPPGANKPVPLVTVLVDYQTISGRVCELANGTVITPGELLPVLAVADIERAVFNPAGRVIDLGRKQRLFVGATRRAVQIADRRCVHPTCYTPAAQCDVHHIEPWEHGGRTDVDNGELRCPKHHPGRRRNPPPEKHSPRPEEPAGSSDHGRRDRGDRRDRDDRSDDDDSSDSS